MRNVSVGGRRTSIRLEPQIWDTLAEICRREFCTPHDVCTHVAKRKSPHGSLASSLRVSSSTISAHQRPKTGIGGSGMARGCFCPNKASGGVRGVQGDCRGFGPRTLRSERNTVCRGQGPSLVRRDQALRPLAASLSLDSDELSASFDQTGLDDLHGGFDLPDVGSIRRRISRIRISAGSPMASEPGMIREQGNAEIEIHGLRGGNPAVGPGYGRGFCKICSGKSVRYQWVVVCGIAQPSSRNSLPPGSTALGLALGAKK